MSTKSEGAAASRGRFWAFVPVGLLGATLIGLGTLISIAVRDPGFALEKNYYDRAVHWDREREQVATNERLGYGVELALHEAAEGVELELHVTDRGGVALPGARVTVEAFANARSGQRRMLELVAGSDGRYRASLGPAREGLWEFRVEVLAAGERFTRVLRADVAPRRHT